MSESPSASGSPGLSSAIDLEELSGLDRIASAYAIGDHSLSSRPPTGGRFALPRGTTGPATGM
jgi:hypothetical protein